MSLIPLLHKALTTGHGRSFIVIEGDPHDIEADPEKRITPAAVLVPVVDRPRPTVIFTIRTHTVRRHKGQIAFPGGRIDPEDDGPIDAALREAEEEIGLPRIAAQIIGTGDRYRTITGYEVTPVIAVVPSDLPLVPQPSEVAAIFEAPLDYIMDPAHQIIRNMDYRGKDYSYYEIEWEGRRIWGATAAMIVNLGRRLALVK